MKAYPEVLELFPEYTVYIGGLDYVEIVDYRELEEKLGFLF